MCLGRLQDGVHVSAQVQSGRHGPKPPVLKHQAAARAAPPCSVCGHGRNCSSSTWILLQKSLSHMQLQSQCSPCKMLLQSHFAFMAGVVYVTAQPGAAAAQAGLSAASACSASLLRNCQGWTLVEERLSRSVQLPFKPVYSTHTRCAPQ